MCQNIHILALNLHLLISQFLLFCSILFLFCVFYVFVSHGRKESVSENLSIKGQFWAFSILLLRSSVGDSLSSTLAIEHPQPRNECSCDRTHKKKLEHNTHEIDHRSTIKHTRAAIKRTRALETSQRRPDSLFFPYQALQVLVVQGLKTMNFLGFLGFLESSLEVYKQTSKPLRRRDNLEERNWRLLLGEVFGSFFSLLFLVLF